MDHEVGYPDESDMPRPDMRDYTLQPNNIKSTYVRAFLDTTKAFDSVNHSILLNILKTYGIQSPELSWISLYLKGQQRYVNIKHTHNNRLYGVSSKLKYIKYSEPKGQC